MQTDFRDHLQASALEQMNHDSVEHKAEQNLQLTPEGNLRTNAEFSKNSSMRDQRRTIYGEERNATTGEEIVVQGCQQLTSQSSADTDFLAPAAEESLLKGKQLVFHAASNPFNAPKSPDGLATEAETPILLNTITNAVGRSTGSGHSFNLESATVESDSIEMTWQRPQMADVSEHDDTEYQDILADEALIKNEITKDKALKQIIDSSLPPLNPENDSTAPTARPGLMRTPSGKVIMGSSRRLSLTVDIETGKEGGGRGQCAVVSNFGGEAVAP